MQVNIKIIQILVLHEVPNIHNARVPLQMNKKLEGPYGELGVY